MMLSIPKIGATRSKRPENRNRSPNIESPIKPSATPNSIQKVLYSGTFPALAMPRGSSASSRKRVSQKRPFRKLYLIDEHLFLSNDYKIRRASCREREYI